jgi:glycosyltransferase involved in cell wall biosynthesis
MMPDHDARRSIRVVVAAPVHMVGGQAQAAAEIVGGFAGDPEIQVSVTPIDPQAPRVVRGLTEWPLIRSFVRPIVYFFSLLARARDADLIHAFCAAHTAFLFGALPALVAGRVRRIPVILNYHDGRAAAHLRWWGAFLRWAIGSAVALVVPSGYLRDVFARNGYSPLVITNVVPTGRITYSPEEPVTPRLISNRLLEPLYRIENSVRAFRLVRGRYPDARLDIYGCGRSERGLRKLVADLGLQGVEFHGRVSADEMARALEGGGIVVNSSTTDNMPHIVIEAFAAGRPLVTTPAGGIPYMVEHERTALVVPHDDPEVMAAAITRLLRDPVLSRRLTEAGHAECRRYTWDVAGPEWRRLYRRVAASSGRYLAPNAVDLRTGPAD